MTRNVPCQTRVAQMENLATEDAGDGEDWLVSHMVKERNLEDEFDILDSEGEIIEQEAEKPAASDEGDEYEDMEGFEDNDILVDDAAAATSSTQEEESNLLKTRTVRNHKCRQKCNQQLPCCFVAWAN